jgi:ABC-2 type transport system ATP-binding protein
MIYLDGLQKVINQRTVIDIPSFHVGEAEIRALVGPAGSGKSTLLSLLLGRSQPTAGTVRVAGLDPYTDSQALRSKVGVLFPEDGLYAQRTALDNLRFHCQLRGLPPSRAEEVLQQVGLADQAKSKPRRMPSGLSRRLAFGRTILHNPSVLLLFEPFARCDEVSISLLGEQIRLRAEGGAGVLILADDTAHLSGVCNAIHLLQRGQVVETDQSLAGESAPRAFKIPVRLEGSVALINPAEIYYAEAEQGRAALHLAEERMQTQFTLGELEQRLARSGFFRAHRGYLVNLQHIKEVIPFTRNSYSLRLDDAGGTLIPLSKTAAAELRDLLGY